MTFKGRIFLFLSLISLCLSCGSIPGGTYLSSDKEIDQALMNLQPGDRLIIGEGRYLFDHTLVLRDIEDVKIFGRGDVWLLCEDPYMDVLSIKNSSGIDLVNLKMRHLKPLEEYSCHGSVLSVKESHSIAIMECELNGCGAIGLETDKAYDLYLADSHIHQNSFTAFYFHASWDFTIENNIIENNGSFLEQYDSENILLENNTEENNGGYWD